MLDQPNQGKLKPTETRLALSTTMIAALGGVAGAFVGLYVGWQSIRVDVQGKNYDVMSGNLASLLTSSDARQTVFALRFIRSYWALNQESFPSELLGVAISISPSAGDQAVQSYLLKMTCGMERAFSDLRNKSIDAEIQAIASKALDDASTNKVCASPGPELAADSAWVPAVTDAPQNAPSVPITNAPAPFVSSGQGYSVYVASNRDLAAVRVDWARIRGRLADAHSDLELSIMRPARQPCWWGLTVAHDVPLPEATARRDRARSAGLRNAYVTGSISAAKAKEACPEGWKDVPSTN